MAYILWCAVKMCSSQNSFPEIIVTLSIVCDKI